MLKSSRLENNKMTNFSDTSRLQEYMTEDGQKQNELTPTNFIPVLQTIDKIANGTACCFSQRHQLLQKTGCERNIFYVASNSHDIDLDITKQTSQ